jgi:23S rRNA (uracil747-C5)-methyltransferase
MDYAQQLKSKEKALQKLLGSLSLEPSTTSDPRGFRNRAKMSVTGTLESPIVGLVGEVALDQGRELLDCPIHHEKLNALLGRLPEYITTYQLTPYSIQEQGGELKGLIAFFSPESQQMYLRFVLRSQESVARIKKLIPVLQSEFPELVCISANVQPIAHAILEGPEELILTNQKTISHRIGALELQLAPQAFVQTNFEVAKKLYQTAAEWIQEAGAIQMLELFSGQGAFSFFAERSVKKALGIEINKSAVKTANETAQSLGLSHVSFKCADVTQIDAEIEKFAPDLILVNPPRRGLTSSVELIRKSGAKNLIYSSCLLESLESDLGKLSDLYCVKKAKIFDMFPHTGHFESLVWLQSRTN